MTTDDTCYLKVNGRICPCYTFTHVTQHQEDNEYDCSKLRLVRCATQEASTGQRLVLAAYRKQKDQNTRKTKIGIFLHGL